MILYENNLGIVRILWWYMSFN